MRHVDDFLDDPKSDPLAVRFLTQARRPAIDKDHEWMEENPLYCTWDGKRWRCVGASRLGDVWLRAIRQPNHVFYDRRVDVAEISEWSGTAERAA